MAAHLSTLVLRAISAICDAKIMYYCQVNEMIAGRDGSSQIRRRECLA